MQQNELVLKGLLNIRQAITETATQLEDVNNDATINVSISGQTNCETITIPLNQNHQEASVCNNLQPIQNKGGERHCFN